MASTTKLEITNEFEDNTRAKVTIDNIRIENLDVADIKEQVRAFNAARGGTLATKMKSSNGLNWIGISKVRIVTTNKTVLF